MSARKNTNPETYTCPMHPEVIQDKPGRCPKCGMDLVKSRKVDAPAKMEQGQDKKGFLETYKALFIIIGLILLPALVLASRDFQIGEFVWQKTMSQFMAAFFLVFSGFKFLNLKGFAQGYFTYDLLAKRVFAYGYLYPFIELSLGLAYLTGFNPLITNLTTLAVMTFSGIGVVKSVAEKRKFQCVCLGTIIDVPLTNVTIIEDFGMALMALVMLLR